MYSNYLVNLFLTCLVVLTTTHPLSDIHALCERYVQCRSISTLDERLCLGNSRVMPFWLPPMNKKDLHAVRCHEKLKPYYRQLEKLETEQSNQLLACLLEQTTPLNFDKRGTCHKDLLNSPKFNYTGDKMKRIPTNCFQGIKNRIERQCGILKDCCSSVNNCANFEKSEISTKINQLKLFIRDFGKKCQLGVDIEKEFSLDEEETDLIADHQPTGNINITIRNPERFSKVAASSVTPEGRVLVRVIPAEEELERLRLEGDEENAKKLQDDLEKVTGFTETLVIVKSTESPVTQRTTKRLIIAEDPPRLFTTSEPESEQDLVPLSPPKVDPPKTVQTNKPYDITDELKRFSKVRTLNRLVEHYKDNETETIAKPENSTSETFPTPLVDSEKLHRFFERWESMIRKKITNKAESISDPEASAEYDRLLRTLNNLRAAIYHNN